MVQQARKSDAADVQIGPVKRFGRYTLVKKLATGGMAEIWLARQAGLAGFTRFVVIKKILSHLAEEDTFVKMFLDEARMSVQLSHPNIVGVYDLGEAEGAYFIAMEFIAGENLAAVAWRGVKRKRPLSPVFAARVIADSCKALHYAHHLRGSNGVPLEIVHRDISPQNILVTYEGEVKVVDFGIAKAATKSQHTKTGMLKGKFSYMSPEQCLGEPLDMRSDIFALGIVLYELCTGKRLFKHESELMILEMITKRRITPPSEVADNIKPELEAIIMKALEKEVDKRYQTAQEMQLALEEFLRHETTSTSADIAAYMRTLFADKIEEKRIICEKASRDDLLEAGFSEEPTEQAGQGRYPGQTPMPGMYGASGPGMPQILGPNGMVMHPQMTGGAYLAGMSQVQGMPFQGQSGVLVPVAPESKSWLPWLIIAVASIVIVGAGALLYGEVIAPPAESGPRMPQKVGRLQLESDPPGALIYINDQTVGVEGSASQARTPVPLSNLQYGTEYAIKLIKEGYEPFETRVRMDETKDNTTIAPKLSPIVGTMLVQVKAGADSRDVRVFINNNEEGFGPDLTRKLVPGTYVVKGQLPGQRCRTDRGEVEIRPARTEWVIVTCDKSGRPDPIDEPAPAPRSGGPRPRPAPAPSPTPRPAPADGCALLDGVPPGYVTINTTPYSIIYYDEKKLGETPLPKVKLPAGCLQIKALNPETKQTVTRIIRVEPNKTLRYQFNLE